MSMSGDLGSNREGLGMGDGIMRAAQARFRGKFPNSALTGALLVCVFHSCGRGTRGTHRHRGHRAAGCEHLHPLSDGRRAPGAQMNFMEWLGLLLSLGILVYLVVALLY